MTSSQPDREGSTKKPARWALIGALAALAVTAGGVVAWRASHDPIGERELISYLDGRTGNKFNFTSVDRGFVSEGDGHLRVTFAATGTAREPLYAKIDAAEYLHRELHVDLPAEGGGSAGAGPTLSKLGPPPPNPAQAILLQPRTAEGASVIYLGTLEATRGHDGWTLAVVEDGFGGGTFPGEKRSSFGSPSFVVGEPGDIAALRALVEARRDYDARASKEEPNADSQANGAQLLAHLAPGAVFRGFALDRDGMKSPALFLEITESSPGDNHIAALLRNDGGWHEARHFEGEWRLGPEGGSILIALSSPPGAAVRDSGPFVEDAQTRSLDLRVEADGVLSGEDRNYKYRFTALSADQAAAQKAALSAGFEAAMAATSPGMTYRGTATPHDSRTVEAILLRIVRRDETGGALEARIESTTRKWQRVLSGSILGNSHRNRGAPLRLWLSGSDAVPAAGSSSVLGCTDDLELHLRLDGRDLVGDDSLFDYRFTPASTGDLQQLDEARSARAGLFMRAFRPGLDLDGNIRDDQGYVVRARLHVAEMEAEGRHVTVTIETRNDPPYSREFTGSFEAADGVLSLETTDHSRLDGSGDVGMPLFSAQRPFSVQLSMAGSTITGHLANDDRLTLTFPADSFLAASPEMPTLPKEAGTYVLKEGAWVPLPRNGGHVVPYKAPSKAGPIESEFGEVLNTAAGTVLHADVGGMLHAGNGGNRAAPRPGKAADLIFDGKDPVPQVSGSKIFVLWVRAATTPTPEAPKEKGARRPRTLIEMAPTTAGKDGIRSVELVHLSSEVDTFGEQRVAAYVHDLEPGAVLFTTTTALEAGDYAVRADDAYEITVR